jgi:hypothetical protein
VKETTLDNCNLAVLTSKPIYEELVKKSQKTVSVFQKTGIHSLSLTAVVERLQSQRNVRPPVTSGYSFNLQLFCNKLLLMMNDQER